MEIVLHTPEDLPFGARQFIEQLGGRRIVRVDGEMGAGKTTFITAVLKAMGIPDPDGSPTYSIINSYHSVYFGAVFHLDVYRLNSPEEAIAIGIEELLYSGGYCFIEWGAKVAELLPQDTVQLTISVNEEGHRILNIADHYS